MSERSSHINDDLLTKYLAGEASESEAVLVEQWIASDPANSHTFKQMKMLWEQSGINIPVETPPVDVELGWDTFKKRLDEESHTPEEPEKPLSKSRKFFYYFTRAAAILIIGALFYLVYTTNKNTAELEVVQLTSKEGTVSDTLPDGSLTFLNVNSTLEYPLAFNEDKRIVSLQGEAFFQVRPDADKPFLVQAEGTVIEVLGTSFYVHAYDTANYITVGVEEGKVKVSTSSSEVVLVAGERLSINSSTEEINPVEPHNPNDLFWKSNTLIFQNQYLSSVFQILEAHYAVDIKVENPQIMDCKLTAKFYGEDIGEIMGLISTNFNLNYQKEGERIIISGEGCE